MAEVLNSLRTMVETTSLSIWTPLSAPFKSFTFPTSTSVPPQDEEIFLDEEVPLLASLAGMNMTDWERLKKKLEDARNCNALVGVLRDYVPLNEQQICDQTRSSRETPAWRMSFNFQLQEPMRTVLVVIVAVVLALTLSIASGQMTWVFSQEKEEPLFDHILIKQED
jgi:hypothetical protein